MLSITERTASTTASGRSVWMKCPVSSTRGDRVAETHTGPGGEADTVLFRQALLDRPPFDPTGPEGDPPALRQVASGGSAIDPEVIARLVQRPTVDKALARLTTREREVLSLMAQGHSNAAIAEQLCANQRTAETHVFPHPDQAGPAAGRRDRS